MKLSLEFKGSFFLDLGIALLIVLLIHLSIVSIELYRHAFSLNALCRWDCSWYSRIAQTGYHLFGKEHSGFIPYTGEFQDDLSNPYAFWPLFPVSMGFISHFLHLPFVLVAEFFNSIFWAITSVVFTRIIGCFDQKSKVLMIALFLTFPFGFYGYIPYSESIYGMLLLVFILVIKNDCLLLAGLVGVLLSISRPTSVPVIAAIYLVKGCLDLKSKRLQQWPLIGSAALSSLGFFSWIIYQWITCGDPIEFLHVQVAWKRQYTGMWQNIRYILYPWKSCWSCVYDGERDPYIFTLLGSVAIPLAIYTFYRRMFIFSAVLSVTFYAAYSHGWDSSPRFILANPVTIAAIVLLISKIKFRYQSLILMCFFVVQQIFIAFWQVSLDGLFI